MSTRVTESPIDANIMNGIKGSALEGAKIIEVDESESSPTEIIEAINSYVLEAQHADISEIDTWGDLSLPLGSLWGEVLVQEFGWEWAEVVQHNHNDFKAVGVFSKDRSLAIYPWYFLSGCIDNHAPAKIALAYNMLKDGTIIPELPANSYSNVMEHVHHIVPPS